MKVSFIMQVYLGEYPGSRSNAIDKFHRAVNSLQSQTSNDWELIIVSDGCLKTQQLYNRSYKQDKNIKFVYYDRHDSELKMYDTRPGDPEEYKYYRGFARRLGVTAASGDLITYMDSDDILAPEFTMTLMLVYNQDQDHDWWMNTTWYDNERADWPDSETLYASSNFQPVQLDYAPGMWKQSVLKPGMIVMSPWLLMHKPGLSVQWRDTYGNVSEDVDFNKRLRDKYKNGVTYARPIYARCHFSNLWDI